MLMRVIYFSSQSYPLSEQDLLVLLEECRSKNARDNITGLLIYRDGSFCQVIEGEEEQLDKLVEKLQKDRRHRNLIILDYRPIAARRFGRWSMAFENLSSLPDQALSLTDLRAYLQRKFQLSD